MGRSVGLPLFFDINTDNFLRLKNKNPLNPKMLRQKDTYILRHKDRFFLDRKTKEYKNTSIFQFYLILKIPKSLDKETHIILGHKDKRIFKSQNP